MLKRHVRAHWGLLILFGLAGSLLVGCAEGPSPDADEIAGRIEQHFPGQAVRVLGEEASGEGALTRSKNGFRVAPAASGVASAFFPEGSGKPLELSLPDGFTLSVRSLDAPTTVLRRQGRLLQRHRDGASVWMPAANGFEEWIYVEADPSREHSRPLRSWEVKGGALRAQGAEVEVLDAQGVVRWRVSAPEAFADGDQPIDARLAVSGQRLQLYVDARAGTGPLLVDPLWLTGPNLSVPRTGHTAQLLHNGKVLIVNGANGGGATSSTDLYDWATHSFSAGGTTADVHEVSATAVASNGKLLLMDFGPLGVETYDVASNTWSDTSDPPVPADLTPFVRLNNGLLLAVGGGLPSGSTNTVASYDPATSTWSARPNFSAAYTRLSAVLLADERLLVVGGFDTVARIYDPATDSWSAASQAPVATSDPRVFLLPNGNVLLFGGGTSSTTSHFYLPGTNTWTTGPSLLTFADSAASVMLPSGRILAAGGSMGGTPGATTQLYDPLTNTWTPGPSMATSRTEATATLLPTGRVLITGGWSGGSTPTATTELFDDFTPTLTSATSLPVARVDLSATLLPSGEVLVAGGFDVSGSPLATAHRYAAGSGSWSGGGVMVVPRARHGSTRLQDGRVLVTGGVSSGGVVTSSTELYDSSANSWNSAGSMGRSRARHTATLLPSGKVLVVGGAAVGAETAELYDPLLGTWSPAPSLSTGRSGHTATLLPSNRVLVCGGGSATCELYDVTSNRWLPAAPMSLSPARSTATLLPNGRVLVTFSGTDSAQLYNPAADTWSPVLTLPVSHDDATATLLPNGKVAVIGKQPHTSLVVSVYDYANNTWSTVTGASPARRAHAASILPNGRVLLVGGTTGTEAAANVDVFDEGRNALPAATPTLTALTDSGNGRLSFTGTGFFGRSLGGQGDWQASQTNFPLLLLRNLENEHLTVVPTSNWTMTSGQGTLPAGLQPGAYLATVIVNGIPSEAVPWSFQQGDSEALFSDDFESGTSLKTHNPPGRWDSVEVQGTNSVAVLPAAAHRGTYGVRFTDSSTANPTAMSGQARLDWRPSPSLQSDLHVRYWFRFTQTAPSAAEVDFFGINGTFVSTGATSYNLQALSDGATASSHAMRLGGHLGPNPPNWNQVLSAFTWAPNTWHLVESSLLGMGTASAEHRVYVDGVQVERLPTNLTGASANDFALGVVYGRNDWVAVVDADDVRVSSQMHASTLALTVVSTAPAESCLPFTLGMRTSTGVARAAPYSLDVTLSSASGTTFYRDASCTQTTGTLTLGAGASGVVGYLRRATSGGETLGARHVDFLPASTPLTWTEPLPRLAFLTPSRTFTAGVCGGASNVITVQLQSAAGGAVPAGAGGLSFTATSTSAQASWWTDSSCTAVAPGGAFTLPAGTDSVDLYYQDPSVGEPIVSLVNGSGLANPAAQPHTVLAEPAQPAQKHPDVSAVDLRLGCGCEAYSVQSVPVLLALLLLAALSKRRKTDG